MKPKIGITIGDMNGIGPELALKAFPQLDQSNSIPLFISPLSVLEHYASILNLNYDFNFITEPDRAKEGKFNVLWFNDFSPVPELKSISEESGRLAMESVQFAIESCLHKTLKAMVTLPISKEAVNKAGYNIPGHTEFLAQETDTDSVLMMLVNENLRVALTTVHIPISKVASTISKELITEKAHVLNQSLKYDFSISDPNIAVLALNPHAGDGGLIGNEEQETIIPTIQELRESHIKVDGPFAADGFFGQKLHLKYDAILAMYHDQGLAPFKLISFGKGVNFTAGLPIIRTSPDHGTAFDIAGKGIADPSSFIQAYNLAEELVYLNKK